jgi:hypothetical protein
MRGVSIVPTRVVYLSEISLGAIPARTFNQTRAKWPELAESRRTAFGRENAASDIQMVRPDHPPQAGWLNP